MKLIINNKGSLIIFLWLQKIMLQNKYEKQNKGVDFILFEERNFRINSKSNFRANIKVISSLRKKYT